MKMPIDGEKISVLSGMNIRRLASSLPLKRHKSKLLSKDMMRIKYLFLRAFQRKNFLKSVFHKISLQEYGISIPLMTWMFWSLFSLLMRMRTFSI